MIDDVLYVGIDATDGRFEDHLSEYAHGSPFDRHLKCALVNGEKFVAVYFGEKTSRNILFETLIYGQLKGLKASQPAAQQL